MTSYKTSPAILYQKVWLNVTSRTCTANVGGNSNYNKWVYSLWSSKYVNTSSFARRNTGYVQKKINIANQALFNMYLNLTSNTFKWISFRTRSLALYVRSNSSNIRCVIKIVMLIDILASYVPKVNIRKKYVVCLFPRVRRASSRLSEKEWKPARTTTKENKTEFSDTQLRKMHEINTT